MRIAVLGNVTVDFIAQDFRRAGDEVYLAPGFDTWRQEALDPASALHAFNPEAILLVFEGPGRAEAIQLLHSSFPPSLHPSLQPSNIQTFKHSNPQTFPPALVVPDLAVLAAETPSFWDERMRQLAAMPFALAGIRAIEEEFRFMLRSAPKKILALDADNTLWKGIVSEDDVDEIIPYAEFQRGVLALRERGVVLVLLSKNDAPGEGEKVPIERMFARADMPLKLEDFAQAKVNWAPKAGNLLEACRELNLGMDSVVFVDDNPHERAQMAAHLPEVEVVPFPRDLAKPGQFLRRLEEAFFAGAGMTEEDRLRAEGYRAEERRRVESAKWNSVEDYLKSLHLRCRPSVANEADVPRLAQMAGKTNQFNATTIRRDEEDFRGLLSDTTKRVWVFRASDDFGDMGLVCYIVADLSTGRLTDLVMSCRAMGRTLEHFALGWALSRLAAEGAAFTGIDYSETAKNSPVRKFISAFNQEKSLKTEFVEAST